MVQIPMTQLVALNEVTGMDSRKGADRANGGDAKPSALFWGSDQGVVISPHEPGDVGNSRHQRAAHGEDCTGKKEE